MDTMALIFVAVYTIVSVILLLKIWRRDVFFAVFLSMMVLYSVITQWGYLVYPEISEIALQMYFGITPLVMASAFSTLSLVALYGGYKVLYCKWINSTCIHLHSSRRLPAIYLLLCSLNAAALAFGYFYYQGDLSYSNASDEAFLDAAGKSYTLFIQIYKFSAFTMLVMYAVVRQKIILETLDRVVSWLLLALIFMFFMATTIAVGSRTDPLALVFGIVGFEYYTSTLKARNNLNVANKIPRTGSRLRKWIWIFTVLGGAAILLTLLEKHRSSDSLFKDTVDVSLMVQGFLLKDYYTPFHVLVGAMSYKYIDPLAVLASNTANSLMFLKVDFLQAYVVNQWQSGLVTRTASPALFAFTEGFVAMGWGGFVYNGVVWSAGIAMWRLLSRTDDEKFNAVAFAITVALCATVARSQSSYFIKDIYLFFAPVLALYCLPAGRRLFRPVMRTNRKLRPV